MRPQFNTRQIKKKPMINALNHLTGRDKQALWIFLGLAILCSFYFASGILVTYVSQPAEAMEEAKDGKGFTVRVLGLQSYDSAEELSVDLKRQYGTTTKIEAGPAGQGYLVIIGPLAQAADAETLKNALQNKHHIVRIVQSCGVGITDCAPIRLIQGGAASRPHSDPHSDPHTDQGTGRGKP
jgi:hypothetical protein